MSGEIPIGQGFERSDPATQAFGLHLPAPPQIVFRPGGTNGGNVVTSLALLLEACQSMNDGKGGVEVVCDFSLVGNAVTTTGQTIDFGGPASIRGLIEPATGVLPSWTFDTCTFASTLTQLAIAQANVIGATSAPWNPTNSVRLVLHDEGSLSGPFLVLSAAGALGSEVVLADSSSIRAGSTVITAGNNVTLEVFAYAGTNLGASVLAATGSGAIAIVPMGNPFVDVTLAAFLLATDNDSVTMNLNGVSPNDVPVPLQPEGFVLQDSVTGREWLRTNFGDAGVDVWTGMLTSVYFIPSFNADTYDTFTTMSALAAYCVGKNEVTIFVRRDQDIEAGTFALPLTVTFHGIAEAANTVPPVLRAGSAGDAIFSPAPTSLTFVDIGFTNDNTATPPFTYNNRQNRISMRGYARLFGADSGAVTFNLTAGVGEGSFYDNASMVGGGPGQGHFGGAYVVSFYDQSFAEPDAVADAAVHLVPCDSTVRLDAALVSFVRPTPGVPYVGSFTDPNVAALTGSAGTLYQGPNGRTWVWNGSSWSGQSQIVTYFPGGQDSATVFTTMADLAAYSAGMSAITITIDFNSSGTIAGGTYALPTIVHFECETPDGPGLTFGDGTSPAADVIFDPSPQVVTFKDCVLFFQNKASSLFSPGAEEMRIDFYGNTTIDGANPGHAGAFFVDSTNGLTWVMYDGSEASGDPAHPLIQNSAATNCYMQGASSLNAGVIDPATPNLKVFPVSSSATIDTSYVSVLSLYPGTAFSSTFANPNTSSVPGTPGCMYLSQMGGAGATLWVWETVNWVAK